MKKIVTTALFLMLAACAKDYGDLTEVTHKNIDKLVESGTVCENGTERDLPCGLNSRGERPQLCVKGAWSWSGDCVDPDVCLDDDTRDLAEDCGLNGKGTQPQICVTGQWQDTGTCDDPDVCTNDDTQTAPCGLNGRGEKPQLCADGEWMDDGACVDPDECLDDEKRTLEKIDCLETIADQPQTCEVGQWVADGLCVALPPTITPDEGTFHIESSQIAMTTETEGATIKYTTDGSEPTELNGIEYTAAFTLSIPGKVVVKAKTFKSGMTASASVTASYWIIVGTLCTGQTKCYGATAEMTCPSEGSDYYGQDAQYAALGYCTPRSYTVSGSVPEEIVTDNVTELEWQRTISTSTYNWANAITYCNNLTYAGHNDWRLPNDRELVTLVDYGRHSPSIDTVAFPGTPSSGRFWSSLTHQSVNEVAFCLYFDYGAVAADNKSANNYYVRCVRGTALAKSTFTETTVSGKILVTDAATGLVWTKEYSTAVTWRNALAYCENLNYSGYSDWRLPNINDLKTLINREKYNPPSDFPDMLAASFWSSSSFVGDLNDVWSVDFGGGGGSNGTSKSNSLNARCVR